MPDKETADACHGTKRSGAGPKYLDYLFRAIAAAGVPLLLTNIFPPPTSVVAASLWNHGHILFFFAVTWLALEKLDRRLDLRLLALAIIALALTSVGIEAIQSTIGRGFDFADIYRNFLGASLAVACHPESMRARPTLRGSLLAICVLLIGISLLPLARIGITSIYGYSSFPVLADFETPFEIERWFGEHLAVRENQSRPGHSLSKVFDTGEFSSVTLNSFPADWRKFACLGFSVYSRQADTVALELKIHDSRHRQSGYEYHDRFNEALRIAPGKNEIVVSLEAVKNAPRGREMDLGNIVSLSLFTHSLPAAVELRFDDFRLIDRKHCGENDG
ncbi:MAG: hypothetical protein PVI79_13175 [Gammaproteobacteria bacterium]|jgi:VanZ family protein